MTIDNASFFSERWENYRSANNQNPEARNNELAQMYMLIKARPGEHILEVGTGNGCLTLPLAHTVGTSGKIVTADVSLENIKHVLTVNRDELPIVPLLLSGKDFLIPEEYEGSFDAVASIATFHHFDNRQEKTGVRGRRGAINAFYRALKSGGRVVVADPITASETATYFEAINNPRHCFPSGHQHDFFSKDELLFEFRSAGFKDISIEVKSVPWKFSSTDETKTFLHTIHNAKCSRDESFALAEKILGFQKKDDMYELGWSLFFLMARK